MPRSSSYSLWLAIPVLTTLNQTCMKLLAVHMQDTAFGWQWAWRALQTPWMLGILLCEIVGFALWLTILSDTSISKAMPITSISYCAILLMSWTVFEEPIVPLQLVGSYLILAGAWLIGTASPKKQAAI